MIACRECAGPVPLKQPGQPGTQRTYCSDRCMWRARQRAHRQRNRGSALRNIDDVTLASMSQRDLARLGIDVESA